MKSKIVKNVEVRLCLDEDEAKWLKDLMQNPIGYGHDEDEENNDKLMRELFWDALKDIDITK